MPCNWQLQRFQIVQQLATATLWLCMTMHCILFVLLFFFIIYLYSKQEMQTIFHYVQTIFVQMYRYWLYSLSLIKKCNNTTWLCGYRATFSDRQSLRTPLLQSASPFSTSSADEKLILNIWRRIGICLVLDCSQLTLGCM